MTSPPIGTDEELPCDHCGKLERQHVAIIGSGLVCPMQGCTFSNSKSRALVSRIAEVERLREALNAIHEARLRDGADRGYGWSITKLNRAMNNALLLLGKPVPPPMLTDEQVAKARAALSQHRSK